MAVTVVSLPSEIFDDGTIRTWKQQHPQAEVFSSIEAVPRGASKGLFGGAQGAIVYVEKFLAHEVRELHATTTDDVLVISASKTSAKLDKDGIVYKNLVPSPQDSAKAIARATGVSPKTAAALLKKTDSVQSAYILGRQLSYNTSRDMHFDALYDPFGTQPAPWNMFQAIVNGDSSGAIAEAERLLRTYRNPQDLFFQIFGYMRKIIVAPDDRGDVLAGSNAAWFKKMAAGCCSIADLQEDLVVFYDRILNNRKDSYVLVLACVASLASRFRQQ